MTKTDKRLFEGVARTAKRKAPQACSKCEKALQRPAMVFTCPSCKVPFCWQCWCQHYDAQLCAYSRAKVVDVL